jgi:hypothetical protein
LIGFAGKEIAVSWSMQADFQRVGARVEVALVTDDDVTRHHAGQFPPARVIVQRDSRGARFLVQRRWTVTVNVAHVDAARRQLLLLADHFRYGPGRYSRFLCGQDGGEWFVTALPASACPCTVDAARAALNPSVDEREPAEPAALLA